MLIVRQSTARTVTVGPVLDADGAAVTGGVVGDFKVAKNGGAPAALNGSATLTHRHTGFYSLALTASDLDTVGQAEVVIDDTVNACPMKELTVVEEAVYDALFAASAAGYQVPIWSSASATVSLTNTTVATVTTTGTATAVTTVNGLAANVITAASIAADAITDAKVASDVTIASVTGAVGSVTGAVGSVTGNVGGNVAGSVGSVTGAVGSVTGLTASDVGAIKAKTDNLPSDPADQSLIIAATNAIIADTEDIQARLPSSLGDNGNMKADLQDMTGLAVPPAYGQAVLFSVLSGTADAGGTTTSVVTAELTVAGAAADQFKGRILIFRNDTATEALRGQATDITASTTGAAPTLTVTALTTAPAAGDTFIIQ
jgi:hypothetical protein